MTKKSVAFCTLGCKVNQYESDAMAQQFINEGYSLVDFEDIADIYVVNTCTVTNISDKKSRQMLRRARRRNPHALVIAVGCYVQVAPQAVSEMDVDILLGSAGKKHITKYAAHAQRGRRLIIIPEENSLDDMDISSIAGRTRAFVKVQDGCDSFCSYCIIPFARGVPRSRPPEQVYGEAARLTENGFCELVLTGINLSRYGCDLGETALIDLIEHIHPLPRLARLRLGSLNPRLFTGQFTARLAALPKVCPHFHISLQSGCDSVLRRMNRPYSTSEYAHVLDSLRSRFAGVRFTTDIITGFPGETPEEFEATCRFVQKMAFSDIHVFPYSERAGTHAAAMKEQLPRSVREERAAHLSDIGASLRLASLDKMTGQSADLLLEQRENGLYTGFTANYLPVRHADKEGLTGKIKTVFIKGVNKEAMALETDNYSSQSEFESPSSP